MSKHLQVPDAVKALIETALPGRKVIGLSVDDAKPDDVDPLGQVIVWSGDPGDADIDLSPPTYNYDRELPIELAAYETSAKSAREQLGEMLAAIGASIEADRLLGGLCIWLDASAPLDGETDERGTRPIGWVSFSILASYTTTSPLG